MTNSTIATKGAIPGMNSIPIDSIHQSNEMVEAQLLSLRSFIELLYGIGMLNSFNYSNKEVIKSCKLMLKSSLSNEEFKQLFIDEFKQVLVDNMNITTETCFDSAFESLNIAQKEILEHVIRTHTNTNPVMRIGIVGVGNFDKLNSDNDLSKYNNTWDDEEDDQELETSILLHVSNKLYSQYPNLFKLTYKHMLKHAYNGWNELIVQIYKTQTIDELKHEVEKLKALINQSPTINPVYGDKDIGFVIESSADIERAVRVYAMNLRIRHDNLVSSLPETKQRLITTNTIARDYWGLKRYIQCELAVRYEKLINKRLTELPEWICVCDYW